MKEVIDLLKKALEMIEEESEKEKVLLADLNPGDVLKIGEHDFIVLKHENEETKVISKNLLKEKVVFDGNTRNYNESNLKDVIESEIQPIIEDAVGEENLVEHEVSLKSVDMQNEFGSCKCKARPISFDEVREFNNLLVNEDFSGWYWTLTSWSSKDRGYEYSIAVVSPRGYIDCSSCDCSDGVRPVCILKSNIFVSKGE